MNVQLGIFSFEPASAWYNVSMTNDRSNMFSGCTSLLRFRVQVYVHRKREDSI